MLNQYNFVHIYVSNKIFQVFASILNMLITNSNQATLFNTRFNFSIALPPSKPLVQECSLLLNSMTTTLCTEIFLGFATTTISFYNVFFSLPNTQRHQIGSEFIWQQISRGTPYCKSTWNPECTLKTVLSCLLGPMMFPKYSLDQNGII